MARKSWRGVGHPKPAHERSADTYRAFRRNASRGERWQPIYAKGTQIIDGTSEAMIHKNRRHREDGRDYF